MIRNSGIISNVPTLISNSPSVDCKIIQSKEENIRDDLSSSSNEVPYENNGVTDLVRKNEMNANNQEGLSDNKISSEDSQIDLSQETKMSEIKQTNLTDQELARINNMYATNNRIESAPENGIGSSMNYNQKDDIELSNKNSRNNMSSMNNNLNPSQNRNPNHNTFWPKNGHH